MNVWECNHQLERRKLAPLSLPTYMSSWLLRSSLPLYRASCFFSTVQTAVEVKAKWLLYSQQIYLILGQRPASPTVNGWATISRQRIWLACLNQVGIPGPISDYRSTDRASGATPSREGQLWAVGEPGLGRRSLGPRYSKRSLKEVTFGRPGLIGRVGFLILSMRMFSR